MIAFSPTMFPDRIRHRTQDEDIDSHGAATDALPDDQHRGELLACRVTMLTQSETPQNLTDSRISVYEIVFPRKNAAKLGDTFDWLDSRRNLIASLKVMIATRQRDASGVMYISFANLIE